MNVIEEMRPEVCVNAKDFLSGTEYVLSDVVIDSVEKVFFCSELIESLYLRKKDLFQRLMESGIERAYRSGFYREELIDITSDIGEYKQLESVLRQFRTIEMCRIAWRDIAGFAPLEETMRALTELAESCIDIALDKLHGWLKDDWGVPQDANGIEQKLVVLGMGKLGAYELNYSSDVDLIFCFPEKGKVSGKKDKSNDEFFQRLGKQLISIIDDVTEEGFVFRVDMRLRPFGSTGPLAMSFSAFEHYYTVQGRSWERYAMIKARVIAGDFERGDELLNTLKPFVYRKYLDYGAFESLREMKAMVAKEVKKKGIENNIKLAWGGIREIEFIGQAFQLIRGGREKSLQVRGIQQVLPSLAALNILEDETVKQLLKAYEFLRFVENRIQQIRDQQTHMLPDSALDRARIFFALGYDDWDSFIDDLSGYRNTVQHHFDLLISQEGEEEEVEGFDFIWSIESNDEEAIGLLVKKGFEDGVRAAKIIEQLIDSHSFRMLSDEGRSRFKRLFPGLLKKIAEQEEPQETLERIVDLLIRIISRSCYVSLLLESETACLQLVKLCASSSWISEFLSRSPILLDDLLHPATLYSPLKYKELDIELRGKLENVSDDDLEQQMEMVRQFKHTNTLRVAAADVNDGIDIMKVSDRLTEMAEVILQNVFEIAYRGMVKKHGEPKAVVDGKEYVPEFLIVAYGKMGGIELSYSSDLDLVFLHNSAGKSQYSDGERSIDNATFFARLGQKIIHFLDSRMPSGTLYEVDMRLRPNGNSGMLVSGIDAFKKYQNEKAWTWEHQALVRARAVAGSKSLAEEFFQIREQVLTKKREKETLRQDILDMRDKMRAELEKGGDSQFDIKQGKGGVTDIEFMVQYLTLLNASKDPKLVEFTDNIRILEAHEKGGIISSKDRDTLIKAYRKFRACSHRLAIKEKKAFVGTDQFSELREDVTKVWERVFD